MRVAFLLKGGVSYTTGSFRHHIKDTSVNDILDLKSSYVNYRSCHASIKEHIIEANPECDFDFYLQSWHPDLGNDLNALYDPISHIHEDNTLYLDEIQNKLKITNSPDKRFGQASMALSIRQVTQLFEKSAKTKYDLVIFYRYDVLLWKDMLLSNYSNDEIYANHFNRGDFHFVMNHDNALKFGMNLFGSLSKENPPREHHMIGEFVSTFDGLKGHTLLGDGIIPGAYPGGFQEVVRKLPSCVNKTISETELGRYGLTLEEIQKYNTN